MKVVIVGAGNVATHLAKALFERDHQVLQVWSKHEENALALAKAVDAVTIPSLENLELNADLCLVSVKDDAIAAVAEQLGGFKGIVAHTAGAVPLHIFDGKVNNYGVFYPLQTFSKAKDVDFRTIPLCLEANSSDSLNALREVAQTLSQTVREVNSDQRKILHLSAVFACNFVNHMYALADEMLKANNLDFKLIVPLIQETALKVVDNTPGLVQTGPAIRHDEETMVAHQQMLESHPQLLEIYKMVSNSIKNMEI